jgi:hypothetical protein
MQEVTKAHINLISEARSTFIKMPLLESTFQDVRLAFEQEHGVSCHTFIVDAQIINIQQAPDSPLSCLVADPSCPTIVRGHSERLCGGAPSAPPSSDGEDAKSLLMSLINDHKV